MEEYDHELASRLLSEFLRDYPDGPPPPWFATFDKRALVDWDQLIERLKANSGKELSEITGEVRQYEEWGLLPACHMDDGTPGYPLYTHLRIRFIRELIGKWHYDTAKLRQIIRWEETLIDEILTTEELSYSASQLIESFVFYLESEIANTEKELGRKRNPKKKKTIGESLGGDEDGTLPLERKRDRRFTRQYPDTIRGARPRRRTASRGISHFNISSGTG